MSQLLTALKEYGADVEKTMERFLDDEELYSDCLVSFMEDPGFENLKTALDTANYNQAFDEAHSLKGVSANLGLNPLFDKICLLVETLRSHENEDLEGKYAAILAEKEKVRQILPI
ncbi:MAG: Hpt domain-containing protein [Lachnospiraceae bacterium]|nr:Hpt domain-containing protein [Lachnospiraceae bacterium]